MALTLTPSGWTYGNRVETSSFVLADKETESIWFPVQDGDCCELVCVGGTYADERLKGITKMERTSWSAWVGEHPNTKFVFD